MKRLAYVAYFFPPTGGAGVQRSLKFARYLPEHGWQPTVVTVREAHYWMRDPTLLAELPADVRVVRTGGLTAPAVLGLLRLRRAAGEMNARRSEAVQRRLRRLAGAFFVPDPYVGWVPHAARAAREILAEGGALLTTSSPDSAHMVGLRLRRPGVAWVADFRDPWVRRMSFEPVSPFHRRAHVRLEARVVRGADRVVVTSEATRADFLRRYGDLDPDHVAVIPNGYDEEDFPAEAPSRAERFTLLHMGQLNPERGIVPMLDHLERFLALRPAALGRIHLEAIGPRYLEDEEAVRRRGLADAVSFEDAMPHRDAIRRLLRAHVSVLLEQESERGSLVLPGKVFEYLRAGLPILGLVPHGAAWDLITRLEAGRCALPSDPGAGAAYLCELWDAYAAGLPPPRGPLPSTLRVFERRALARQLASVLDDAASAHPARRPPRPFIAEL